jgi:amino acid adenylation domain-containing protein
MNTFSAGDLEYVSADVNIAEVLAHGVHLVRTDGHVHAVSADGTWQETVPGLSSTAVASLAQQLEVGPTYAPMSPSQRRMWLLDQLDPGSPAYWLNYALEFRGPIDIQAWEESLNVVVQRHDAYRTLFPTIDGEPVQAIHPSLPVEFEVVDFTSTPEDQREQTFARYTADALRRPKDLKQGPLFRNMLIRFSDTYNIWFVTSHHIIWDGWSAEFFLREAAAHYASTQTGERAKFRDVTLQFPDYVRWLQEQDGSESHAEALAYWKDHLSGHLPVINLSTRPVDEDVSTYAGGSCFAEVNAEATNALKELARTENATLFSLLLGALDVLLARLTGLDDILVGVPVAGRQHPKSRRAAGLFVNTVVLRNDCSGTPTFRELLGRVHTRNSESLAHQNLPFEQLVDAVQPERVAGENPIFQVMLNYVNTPHVDRSIHGATGRWLNLSNMPASLPLSFVVRESDGGFQVELCYQRARYDASDADAILQRYIRLLEAIVRDPDTATSAYSLLSENERETILGDWRGETVSFPEACAAHTLFEAEATRNPTAAAVVCGDQAISYGELDRRANQLAHWLLDAGVEPGTPVGLCLPRVPEMVVGELGVLKAGGAYVPLDPSYPQARLAHMIGDASLPVILSHESVADTLPEHDARVLFLDRDWSQVASHPDTPCERTVGPCDLAYIIYTSGSTGLPKGVQVEHRAVWNLVHACESTYGIGIGDRMLQFAPFSFDPSVWELFVALSWGASLHMTDADRLASPPELAEFMKAEAITIASIPPNVLRAMPEVDLPTLRVLISGGEACTADVPARWAQGRQMFNGYGPTECTVCTTVHRFTPDEPDLPPIGRPLANVSAYILDAHLNPVPSGVPGELYLGGAQVARGYLNRPELDAERFVSDPFAGPEAGPLYRTGDRCRWGTDGTIYFLGRTDDQVKIRGIRVELGEIEAALSAQPGIRNCAATVWNDDGQGARPVAYYVVSPDAKPAAQELRDALGEHLPEALVPAAFICIEALPLTPSGKVDRKALPAPSFDRSSAASGYIAPRTELETAMCAIWLDVLGVDRVGIRDTFFEIGGHSLLATRVLAQVSERYAVCIPLRRLFERPTVEALAESVEEAIADAASDGGARIVRRTDESPAHLSFAQQRLWFLHQLDPENIAYNNVAALQLTGQVSVEALTAALNAVIARHDILRTTFAPGDDGPRQVVQPGLTISIPVVPIDSDPATVDRWANEAWHEAFDLTAGPLVRATLLRRSEDDHVLLFAMHHIITDGWSSSILAREVAHYYLAHQGGSVEALPELPVQYADYAVWQRDWLADGVRDAQLSYWLDQLDGMPAALELVTDKPRPAVQSSAGGRIRLDMPEEAVASMHRLSRASGCTPFMTMLATWQALLHRYSGQSDFAVGCPVAGRNRTELEPLIGFFINTLVMRARVDGTATVSDLLASVRQTAVGAFDHQDLPFEQLVDAMNLERDTSRSPLFQATFIYQNLPEITLELPSLTLDMIDTGIDKANHDLHLGVFEDRGRHWLEFEYNADLFERDTVTRMTQHFLTLLAGMAASPEARVDDLPLLTPAEKQKILWDWNATETVYPVDRCLHEEIAAQCARTPQAVALTYEGATMTYGELNARTNQLARWLQGQGVGPEVLVGVCAERSLEIVVALVATLKAGGAYVPLDPAYPQERLAHMVADSAVPVVLTQTHLRDQVPEGAAQVLCLDSEWEQVAAESDAPVTSGANVDNLAYVIYTSGSTGKPKGAMITHRAICNRLYWMQDEYGLQADDRVLQKTPYSFDVSVWEFFWPLMTGSQLVVARPGGHQDPSYLVETIAAQGITTMHFVPSMLQAFLDARDHNGCDSLRCVICSGEALSPELVKRYYGTLVAPLHNLYGPTEAAVDVTYWPCPNKLEMTTVPIGRPVANTQIYVLDKHLKPLPVGVPGELYIGGVQVGRGYLNRPDLTEAAFIPDPFAKDSTSRLYKTGDQARFLPDGTVEYLGRLDFQVKLRGLRIELGEIERALLAHSTVHECVVVVREDTPGDQRLVAYCVPESGTTIVATDLRTHALQSLPEYMVPGAVVTLDVLPLSASGKVDRRALPQPDVTQRDESSYVAPRNDAEAELADLWSALLNVERVGVFDSFFELGGHSLLLTQLASRIEDRFGVKLSLRVLFGAPTIDEMALAILAEQAAEHDPGELETMLDSMDDLSPEDLDALLDSDG